MLLPCAITPIVRVTGSDIITDLKAGMTGIFMPIEYDDTSSRWMENGAELDKRELAGYGFARFRFPGRSLFFGVLIFIS